eukprot:1673612-Pyramimonas_sp.AAC.1
MISEWLTSSAPHIVVIDQVISAQSSEHQRAMVNAQGTCSAVANIEVVRRALAGSGGQNASRGKIRESFWPS